MDFEIGFRLDAQKVAKNDSGFGCGWTPYGQWLYDRHPNDSYGRWMITVGETGQLCFRDMPTGGPHTSLVFRNLPLDKCLTLTASHTAGVLAVSVNGETQTRNTGANPSYRSGPNGIGVGREVNGYHSPWGNDSFPGTIFYVRSGNLYPLEIGTVTGNASLGNSVCSSEGTALTPCEIDPSSIQCACETTPHPACDSCTDGT